MYSRWFNTIVVCFWLSAMSWLAATKILPALSGGDPPDYRAMLEAPDSQPNCWEITWDERRLGFAASQIEPRAEGGVKMRSVVHLERLPVQSMAAELLGPAAAMIQSLFRGSGDLQIETLIATRMYFDTDQRMQRFHTTIDIGQRQGILQIDGHVRSGSELLLEAELSQPGQEDNSRVMRRKIDLPAGALVRDSLAPRPQLKNLRIGQSWTIPVYRLFPPNRPVQMVQAEVQRHDIILWDGEDVETMLVIYRSGAGSDLHVAREPLGKEWIRNDGTVLRREATFSGLQLQFERLPHTAEASRQSLLDATAHPRLWQDGADQR